jgi:hypothetical protein
MLFNVSIIIVFPFEYTIDLCGKGRVLFKKTEAKSQLSLSIVSLEHARECISLVQYSNRQLWLRHSLKLCLNKYLFGGLNTPTKNVFFLNFAKLLLQNLAK